MRNARPNLFKVTNFENFANFKAKDEFDLIAPVMVYFQADLQYKPEARTALQKLKALKHPLVAGKKLGELLKDEPSGLVNRYNALMMKLVEEQAPDAEAYIDTCGAFGFRYQGDSGVLCGDKSGMFAFYLSANAVQGRLS